MSENNSLKDGLAALQAALKESVAADEPNENVSLKDSLISKRTSHGEKALESTRKLLASDPDNVELQDWYAFLLYGNGDFEEAARYYERLIHGPSAKPEHFYYLANACYCLGNVTRAAQLWRDLVVRWPDRPLADKARKKLERLAAEHPMEKEEGPAT